MEFAGKLTEAEFTEFRRMARSKVYWAGVLLACVGMPFCIWQAVSIVLRSSTPTAWGIFIIGFAAATLLILFARYDQKRQCGKRLAELNTKYDRFIFASDGVKSEVPDGATKLFPWASFKDWQEGQQVLLLNTYTSGTIILPITQLSEMERQPIRQFVQSHITLASRTVFSFRAQTKLKAELSTGAGSSKLLDSDSKDTPAQVWRDSKAVLEGSAMEFTSRLTEAEFNDFKRVTRTITDRLSYLAPQILWFLMFWAFVGTDLLSRPPHWDRDAYISMIFAGGYVGYLIALREMEARRLDDLNGSLDLLQLTDRGVECHSISGRTDLLRWGTFYGWREGRHVIVLENSKIKFLVLPVTNLSERERKLIQLFLQSHIGSAPERTSDFHNRSPLANTSEDHELRGPSRPS